MVNVTVFEYVALQNQLYWPGNLAHKRNLSLLAVNILSNRAEITTTYGRHKQVEKKVHKLVL